MSTPVSIVIRAFNEEQHLGRLLDGILQQTLKEIEIILVDSGSTDGTLEVAQRYPVQVVRIQPQEFTFGYSLNQGVSHARHERVVIASAHVYPTYPDWLERLTAPLADPNIALTYGKQRGDLSSRFSEGQIFQHWYPDISQPRQATPFCNNANAAIRRTVWEKNRYNESLSGLEDLEWAHRIMALGGGIAYVAEAEVVHVHNETAQGVYNRYRREAMAFKRIFPQERFHWWNLLHAFTTNAASDIWHASLQHQLRPHLGDILWFRWMQFWGTYQGYRRSGPLTWKLRQTFYYPRGAGLNQAPAARNVEPIQYQASLPVDQGRKHDP